MYYKEQWINGKLYFKTSPNSGWVEFTKKQYAERVLKLENILKQNRIFIESPF